MKEKYEVSFASPKRAHSYAISPQKYVQKKYWYLFDLESSLNQYNK